MRARVAVAVHVLVADPAGARAAVAGGARRVEVALGRASLAEEDYRLARIRARAGAAIELGVDARPAGWGPDDARRALPRVAAHRPAWVLDPLPAHELAALGPPPVPLLIDLSRTDLGLAALRRAGAAGVVIGVSGREVAVVAALVEEALGAGLLALVATSDDPADLRRALEVAARAPGVTLLLRTAATPTPTLDDGDLLLPV
jgi:hypothetical protein